MQTRKCRRVGCEYGFAHARRGDDIPLQNRDKACFGRRHVGKRIVRPVVYHAELFAQRRQFIIFFMSEKRLRNDKRIVTADNGKRNILTFGKSFYYYVVERRRIMSDQHATA